MNGFVFEKIPAIDPGHPIEMTENDIEVVFGVGQVIHPVFLRPFEIRKGICEGLDDFVGIKLEADEFVALDHEVPQGDNG